MNAIRNPLLVLGAMYVVFISLLVVTAGQLPERMATHFNFAGRPDGWMSRQGYLAFTAGFGLLFPLLLPLLSLGFRALPASVINIPHREYWLSPERREETNAYLVQHALWLAVLQLGLVLAIHLLSVRANQQSPPHLSNAIWGCLLVFLAGVGVWTWMLVRRFSYSHLRSIALAAIVKQSGPIDNQNGQYLSFYTPDPPDSSSDSHAKVRIGDAMQLALAKKLEAAGYQINLITDEADWLFIATSEKERFKVVLVLAGGEPCGWWVNLEEVTGGQISSSDLRQRIQPLLEAVVTSDFGTFGHRWHVDWRTLKEIGYNTSPKPAKKGFWYRVLHRTHFD